MSNAGRLPTLNIRGFVGCSWADSFTYPEEMALPAASRAVLNGDTWVRSAFAQLSEVPGVHRSGLALAEGGGRRLLFTASDRDNELGVDWCEVPAYEDVPLNLSVRTGEQVVGSLDDLAGRYPVFTGRQTASTCAADMRFSLTPLSGLIADS